MGNTDKSLKWLKSTVDPVRTTKAYLHVLYNRLECLSIGMSKTYIYKNHLYSKIVTPRNDSALSHSNKLYESQSDRNPYKSFNASANNIRSIAGTYHISNDNNLCVCLTVNKDTTWKQYNKHLEDALLSLKKQGFPELAELYLLVRGIQPATGRPHSHILFQKSDPNTHVFAYIMAFKKAWQHGDAYVEKQREETTIHGYIEYMIQHLNPKDPRYIDSDSRFTRFSHAKGMKGTGPVIVDNALYEVIYSDKDKQYVYTHKNSAGKTVLLRQNSIIEIHRIAKKLYKPHFIPDKVYDALLLNKGNSIIDARSCHSISKYVISLSILYAANDNKTLTIEEETIHMGKKSRIKREKKQQKDKEQKGTFVSTKLCDNPIKVIDIKTQDMLTEYIKDKNVLYNIFHCPNCNNAYLGIVKKHKSRSYKAGGTIYSDKWFIGCPYCHDDIGQLLLLMGDKCILCGDTKLGYRIQNTITYGHEEDECQHKSCIMCWNCFQEYSYEVPNYEVLYYIDPKTGKQTDKGKFINAICASECMICHQMKTTGKHDIEFICIDCFNAIEELPQTYQAIPCYMVDYGPDEAVVFERLTTIDKDEQHGQYECDE